MEDHCRAIWQVLLKGNVGETYNIGGNSEKRNLEVVETICDILDEKVGPLPTGESRRTLIRFVKDRAGHDRRYAIDAEKTRTELGWTPSVNFEEGIRKTVDWHLNHRRWCTKILDGNNRRKSNEPSPAAKRILERMRNANRIGVPGDPDELSHSKLAVERMEEKFPCLG